MWGAPSGIWVLYAERGCGCWLLGALWGTLFTLLRAPVVVLKGAAQQLRDVEQGEEMAFMPRAPPKGSDRDDEAAYLRTVSPLEKVLLFTEDVD